MMIIQANHGENFCFISIDGKWANEINALSFINTTSNLYSESALSFLKEFYKISNIMSK